MFADEVNGDVGLAQATLDRRHQFTGDEGQRLPRDDRMPQLDQLPPQLVPLRFEVRRRGGQEDGLRVRRPPVTLVSGVPQIFEHLGDVVSDVVHPLVKSLQRDIAERFVEFPQPTRLRVALEELVGHQAGVQAAKAGGQLAGLHGRLDHAQQPAAMIHLHPPGIRRTLPE